MTNDQLPLGFNADADDQSECEVCREARQDSHIEILSHLVLAAGSIHVLIWRPEGWAATFGREIGVIVTAGIDETPMSPGEAEQVAHALLDAVNRIDR